MAPHPWTIGAADPEVESTVLHCQCGKALGEPCAWSGPREEMVVVEWTPESLRDDHREANRAATRRWGAYPRNGAIRLLVERSCADLLRCTGAATEDGCAAPDCPVHARDSNGQPPPDPPWARLVEERVLD